MGAPPHRPDQRSRPDVGISRTVLTVVVAFLAGVAAHMAIGGADPRPAESPAGPAAAPNVPTPTGHTRLTEGVPAGFARTEAGATAAAASFVTTGQTLIDLDPLAAEQSVRQMAASATADEQVRSTLEDLRLLRDALREGSGPITFRQAALASRVDRFDGTRATVAVWSVGVLSREQVAPPQAGWRISTFELVWERGDWRIANETISPGPAPVIDDSAVPATSAELASTLAGFEPLASGPPAWEPER